MTFSLCLQIILLVLVCGLIIAFLIASLVSLYFDKKITRDIIHEKARRGLWPDV